MSKILIGQAIVEITCSECCGIICECDGCGDNLDYVMPLFCTNKKHYCSNCGEKLKSGSEKGGNEDA